jgi:mannose-6-phosphate isomerase-like protein (cupin superfamily)
MPVISHEKAPEIPWRPGYRNFILAGKEQGLSCVVGYSVIEPGRGAPLHMHKTTDEVFVVLEGALDMRIGEDRLLVQANHTIAIPAGVPHAFVAVGPGPMRMYTFMPQSGAIADATVYLEDEPPAGAGQH